MEDLYQLAILLRLVERLVLTAVIVVMSAVVSVGFWRSMQKVEFQADKSVGLSGNMVLATPAFVLLALVGYAWVSLNAPISVDTPVVTEIPALSDAQSGPAGVAQFTGLVGAAPAQDPDKDLADAARQVQSLNCLAQRARPLSARLYDDMAAAKLAVLEPVWQPDLGDFAALRDWAMGLRSDPPAGPGRALFDDTAPLC